MQDDTAHNPEEVAIPIAAGEKKKTERRGPGKGIQRGGWAVLSKTIIIVKHCCTVGPTVF